MNKKIKTGFFKSKKFVTFSIITAMCLCFLSGYTIAYQPHMRNAENYLMQAKDELQKATHNKGGHRVKAIDLVNQALWHVREGIRDARE